MSDITIAQITEGTVDGDGIFDKLMQAGEAHLFQEYQRSRITGKEYSTVYLGMMQSAMAQAMQFVLGEQQADKQADLITEQTLSATAQTALLAEQLLKTTAEKELLAQKKVTEVTQTTDATGGTTKKQQDLILAQTDGFARDAEQKLAKIATDGYHIQRTTDSALAPPTSLADANINTIMALALAGIS